MRRALILAASLVLAGCVNIAEQPTGPGTYQLSTDYDWANPRYGLIDQMNRRALQLCGGGYEKVHEADHGTGSAGTVTWDVRCAP